ncbi:maternal embryonic leucine zipper kinase isoform X2 [Nematostella vectensis]|uniref:maternal embryonic leucine zipper kinase isoform X2 n=1 Tax=Nematostella vectensis TaxID=45351 RepID=UPI0020775452|nr:maternal embryonic leucine zipper kinase isoform X2 [Nematostella vectensis]
MPTPAFPVELSKYYDVRETIGSGGFAKVKLAVHRTSGEKVAIKMMNKEALGHDLPRVQRELEAMKDLCHQHICQLYHVIETDENIYMVLEYAQGGELFDYIVAKDRLKEDEARGFFRQIISAVAYIHEKGYAHRDLKPENLLLDEEQNIKLIDFGLVAKPEGGMTEQLETCCGSPAYAAPELISGLPYFGNEVDLWSMGVLLYALVCGFLPFDDDNTYKLYRLIQKGEYEIPSWLSQGTVAILGQLLQVSPRKRAKIQDLVNHDWVMKGYAAPVKWQTKIKRDKPEMDVIKELAAYYEVSTERMAKRILEWKYDHATATYFLLRKKKSQGERPQLLPKYSRTCNDSKENKQPNNQKNENEKEDFALPPPKPLPYKPKRAILNNVGPMDDLERKPRADTMPDNIPSTPTTKEIMPPPMAPYTPRRGVGDIPMSKSDYHFGATDLTPISQSKIISLSLDMDLDKKGKGRKTPFKSPFTPRRRVGSERGTPSTAGKKGAIMSSIEEGLNKVIDAITPKRSALSGAGPRKVKALYNVSTSVLSGYLCDVTFRPCSMCLRPSLALICM